MSRPRASSSATIVRLLPAGSRRSGHRPHPRFRSIREAFHADGFDRIAIEQDIGVMVSVFRNVYESITRSTIRLLQRALARALNHGHRPSDRRKEAELDHIRAASRAHA